MTRPVGARPFSTNGYRVRPQKMADMVAGRIRQMIARGAITDGEWLPTEPELMEQFGVSRPTLREAFRVLESESLISVRRGAHGGQSRSALQRRGGASLPPFGCGPNFRCRE